jgi:hypothetical protein
MVLTNVKTVATEPVIADEMGFFGEKAKTPHT